MANDALALPASYAEGRRTFLDAADRAGAQVESVIHPLQGPDDEELAIDLAVLGPDDPADTVFVVSGTHGVEGFCGSALQSRWLESLTDPHALDRRVILLHALNPFGFAWVRRVNEDNVDLNRNFIDWSGPVPHNDPYDGLADLLVGERWDDEQRAASLTELAAHLERLGPVALQAAITAGQYRHPTGLFYGGAGPTWSNRVLTEVVGTRLGSCERLVVIDLHSGLGPWGHGEYIVHHPADHPAFARATAMWPSVASSAEGESVSVLLSGDWLDRLDALLPQVEITSAALEFGTVDPVTVLTALRGDAWLWAHDDPSGPRAAEVRDAVYAAFASDDPAWIATLWDQFAAAMDAALR